MDRVLLILAIVFLAARVGAEVAHRLKTPSVVGEIAAGILIGPALLGWIPPIEAAPHSHAAFEALAELGVIFLLFTVGLETDLKDLKRVGGTASAVAIGGIVLPFALGFGVMLLLGSDGIEAAFVGTAMVATSVGVTARVLQEKGKLATTAAKVVLAAAVLDDILGLVILSIVAGLGSGGLSAFETFLVAALGISFPVVLVVVGRPTLRRLFPWVRKLKMTEPVLGIAIVIALWLAVSADFAGLAPIIGAFIAGILFRELGAQAIEMRMDSIAVFLVPFFFVYVGTLVEPSAVGTLDAVLLVSLITFLAFIGKFVGGGLGAIRYGLRPAAIVGVGMVPRGEVGIIVASLGLARGVIDAEIYGVVVLMSLITTIIAPPLLSWLYSDWDKKVKAAAKI